MQNNSRMDSRGRNQGFLACQDDNIVCAGSADHHQGSARYSTSAGRQCTANACVAVIYSIINDKRTRFDSEDFDVILDDGNALYVEVEPKLPAHVVIRYLAQDDIPTEIRVGDKIVTIASMADNYIFADGHYPDGPESLNRKILRLKNSLENLVFNETHDDSTDGILFTGLHATVSFWRHNNRYYLFNSHAVNAFNKTSGDGVARLFEFRSLEALATSLLCYGLIYEGIASSTYQMTRVRVLDTRNIDAQVPIAISQEVLIQSDDDLTECSSVVIPTVISPIIITTAVPAELSTDDDITQCSSASITVLPILSETPTEPNVNSPPSSSIINEYATPSVPSEPKRVKVSTAQGISDSAQPVPDRKLTLLKPVVVVEKVDDFKLSVLRPVVVLSSLPNESKASSKRGRPIKQKRGRKRTKENAQMDAVKKYNSKKPEVHRDAVKRYSDKNRDVNRKAVQKYVENNPEVHKKSVQKYTQKTPEVHRGAVKKYTTNNPEVHRDSVQKYAELNPQINKDSAARYNQTSRNIDVPLRRSRNLIAQKFGDELNQIAPFALKKSNLYAPDILKCPHCGARLFEEERTRLKWCCGSGAYNVQNFTPLTEEFYFDPEFYKKARLYNSMFAFSASGATGGFNKQPTTGIAFFKLQGRTYHRIFDLAYSQSMNNVGLYISDFSVREGIATDTYGLDLRIIRLITNYLHNVNPYIECFKRLSREASSEAFIQFERTSRATHGNILGDQPLGREVAAIINTERDQFNPRSIAVWKIGERKAHTIDIMDPLYEPLQYPLLYERGNPGWYPGKLDNHGNKLTQAKYVRCLLLSDDRFSVLGRLSEEWMCDMFSRITEERLRYLHHMQTKKTSNELRSAPLQELLNDETILAEGIVPGRVYLPSSFTNCPRYMQTKYLDCIALVNRLGPPSYFITFTCNPKWPEIKQSTPAGQFANPLICARAFNLRLQAFIRDLRCGLWFGKVDYLTYVIEFQKRGLPHAHVCFRVEGGGPANNVDIDKVCRADIPDASEANGSLQKAVLGHMIHGPCGRGQRDNLPCYDREKNKCAKRFPKKETDVTFCDNHGFIHLRRDSNNKAVIRHRGTTYEISDLWVVPYNAALLLKYDAHINVEVSSRRSVVKYLFKYMTKGPDETRVTIVDASLLQQPQVQQPQPQQPKNEITEFETKKYVGSSDAVWRILEFDITSREPNVKQLSVHLEDRQTVYFTTANLDEVLNNIGVGGSDMITYFNRPQGDAFDDLKYVDFYEKFIVHAKRPSTKNVAVYETGNGKFVTARQRGELVARLFWVAPNRGEQFYLRMLLLAYPCRSYDDLRRLGGPDCATFQEAAKAVGLADDEIEYERAMREAISFFTGHRLRRFFCLLAAVGAPVATLWQTFKDMLSEDILRRMPNDEAAAHRICLTELNRLLRRNGSDLAQHGLPEIQDNSTELGREREEHNVAEQTSIVNEWLAKLSPEQRVIYDYIDKLCVDKQFRDTNPCSIFIDGPAGTGKTLVLNVITAHVRGDLKGVVLCTATSAIAAQNHVGGVTAHSMFKFPIEIIGDTGYWNITNRTQRGELIYHADVIIYDEAPMAHKYLIHLLDRSLRDLMSEPDKVFGGKIVIFAGDFRQIPPVIPDAKSNSDIYNSSLKRSDRWPKFKIFSLLASQRCRDDPDYADFLLKLGSNQLTTFPFQVGNRTIRLVSLASLDIVTALQDLIDFVFPFVVIDEPDVCAHRAILCTRNDAMRTINAKILEGLPGELLHFYAVDKVETENADPIFLGSDMLNRMQPNGFPEFDLRLKIGCVCMIMRNLSPADGLVNGTKVIVENTSPFLITVRKPGGHDSYMIPRILFKGPVEKNSPFEMCRRQFPLQVCYAMTIHKSQGQTIGRVGVDLRSDVFSHGQLYVALGRVREKRNIKVLLHPERIINGVPYANNVVIPELLQ